MATQCPVMAAMQDLDEIFEHMNGFCVECVEAQLREAANGEELIFTEGPPTWIAEADAREAAERAEKERQRKLEWKRKAIEKAKERNGEAPAVTWKSADEAKVAEIRKIAGQKSDRHLEHEIKRILKCDDAEAQQMRLDLKRELAAEKKEKEKGKEKVEVKQQIKQQKEEQKKNPNAPKELNKFQKRPWQPALRTAIAITDERRSALSTEEQKRYVAIISNYHTLEQNTRFDQNKKDIKVYDERLVAERAVVAAMVMESLEKTTVSTKEVDKEVEHVLARWGSRYLKDQRRFERLKQLPWRRDAEMAQLRGVLKPTFVRALMAAPNPKLNLPANMHDRVAVGYNGYAFDPRNKRRSTTISEDKTLLSLCADAGCTVAMECTTAVHLMTRPREPRNYAFHVPVSVFDQFQGGSVHRLCFLDKPRPQESVSSRTLLHMVAKYRAKSTFTKKEDPKPSASQNTVAASSKDTAPVSTSGEQSEEGGGGGGHSLLDDLLGSITVPTFSTGGGGAGGSAAPPAKQSPTAHTYGLFTIPSFESTETRVIVRSSPCPRTDAGTETTLAAKVEYAHDAGVTRETHEDMLWTSMKTVFKGAVNSATVHLHPFMKDALQMSHSRAIPQGNHLNENFFPLLSTRTNRLHELLNELSLLQPGEYMLQVTPSSDEMVVYHASPQGTELFFHKGPRRTAGPLLAGDDFTGIDDKRVLHWQVMQGRAPLTLWPEGHHQLKTYETQCAKGAGQGEQRGQKRPHNSPRKNKSELTPEERKNFNYRNKMRKKAKRGGGGGGRGGHGHSSRVDYDAPQ